MMDIKYRKIIYRFKTVNKLGHSIIKINNNIFYYFYDKLNKNSEKLRKFQGIKNGETCFIVGNGPSLRIEDLEIISRYDSFAANLIFRIFDKTSWRPTYYFVQDRYADTGNALDNMDVPVLFIGDYYWRKRRVKNPNAICMHALYSKDKEHLEFSEDIGKGLVTTWTITYTMIQAAVYMGYRHIYLYGMDHNYSLTYDVHGNVVENVNVVSHFFEDRNEQEVIANIEEMNKAYIAAGDYAQKHGIEIINATRGGKLEWFPRKSVEEMKRGKQE